MANSKNAKEIGNDLKSSGVIGPPSPDDEKKYNISLSAGTYGPGIIGERKLPFLGTDTVSGEVGLYSGGLVGTPVLTGGLKWQPLQKQFDTGTPIGAIGLEAGPFAALAYDSNRGLTPVIGGDITVEHVNSGINGGLRIGLSPFGSTNDNNYRSYYYSNNNIPLISGTIGIKF